MAQACCKPFLQPDVARSKSVSRRAGLTGPRRAQRLGPGAKRQTFAHRQSHSGLRERQPGRGRYSRRRSQQLAEILGLAAC